MEPVVEARVAEPVIMRDPDGNLAATHPIRVGEMCLQCHGERAEIGEKTLARIEELYPEDSATGFAAGDLRGWFWTEETP
jgi:hypothetical protein